MKEIEISETVGQEIEECLATVLGWPVTERTLHEIEKNVESVLRKEGLEYIQPKALADKPGPGQLTMKYYDDTGDEVTFTMHRKEESMIYPTALLNLVLHEANAILQYNQHEGRITSSDKDRLMIHLNNNISDFSRSLAQYVENHGGIRYISRTAVRRYLVDCFRTGLFGMGTLFPRMDLPPLAYEYKQLDPPEPPGTEESDSEEPSIRDVQYEEESSAEEDISRMDVRYLVTNHAMTMVSLNYSKGRINAAEIREICKLLWNRYHDIVEDILKLRDYEPKPLGNLIDSYLAEQFEGHLFNGQTEECHIERVPFDTSGPEYTGVSVCYENNEQDETTKEEDIMSNENSTRAEWIMGNQFATAVYCLNAFYCGDLNGEGQDDEYVLHRIASMVKDITSPVQREDAILFLQRCGRLDPDGKSQTKADVQTIMGLYNSAMNMVNNTSEYCVNSPAFEKLSQEDAEQMREAVAKSDWDTLLEQKLIIPTEKADATSAYSDKKRFELWTRLFKILTDFVQRCSDTQKDFLVNTDAIMKLTKDELYTKLQAVQDEDLNALVKDEILIPQPPIHAGGDESQQSQDTQHDPGLDKASGEDIASVFVELIQYGRNKLHGDFEIKEGVVKNLSKTDVEDVMAAVKRNDLDELESRGVLIHAPVKR